MTSRYEAQGSCISGKWLIAVSEAARCRSIEDAAIRAFGAWREGEREYKTIPHVAAWTLLTEAERERWRTIATAALSTGLVVAVEKSPA